MSIRITDARKRIGLSQKELANRLGIAPSTLNGYEKGVHKPTTDILAEVSSITGCTIDFLIGRTDDFDQYYQKESPPDSDEAEPEGTEKWLIDLLVRNGYISEGEQIDDRTTSFILHWLGALDAFFGKK